MQVAPGSIVGGKYQLERPLARGGMGAVWVARHVKLGSPVAVKFLDAHLAAAPSLVARFEREARSAANLQTPHVVHVHDYGVDDGTPYLVMELLVGEDLNNRLRRVHRIAPQDAGRILTQMGRALRRAHEAGIVHRDLKPGNVFLARVDEEEVVKILDFGIAKETWSRVEDNTKTGEVFGSPHYMSPEQARGQKDVDLRADLWATGVIAYRMLTGHLPFPGEVLGEVMAKVLVDPFPPLAVVAPDLPSSLTPFFEKALAKRKEQRFNHIGEMLDAFHAAISAVGQRGSSADLRPSVPEIRPSVPVLSPSPTGTLPGDSAGRAPIATPPRLSDSSGAAAAQTPHPAVESRSPVTPPVPPMVSARPVQFDAPASPARATGQDVTLTLAADPHASSGQPVSNPVVPASRPAGDTQVPTQKLPATSGPTAGGDTAAPAHAVGEHTGPSITSASRTVSPGAAQHPRSRAGLWIGGVAAVAMAGAVGFWATHRSDGQVENGGMAGPESTGSVTTVNSSGAMAPPSNGTSPSASPDPTVTSKPGTPGVGSTGSAGEAGDAPGTPTVSPPGKTGEAGKAGPGTPTVGSGSPTQQPVSTGAATSKPPADPWGLGTPTASPGVVAPPTASAKAPTTANPSTKPPPATNKPKDPWAIQ